GHEPCIRVLGRRRTDSSHHSRTNTTGAEAPRPARARIDGRSPGSRVVARHRLPGISQWLCGIGSPLTVAGGAAALEAGLDPPSAPHSLLSLCRETVDRRNLTVAARRLSM